MSTLDNQTSLYTEAVAWRRYLHSIPETGFDVFLTSSFVADRLREFGCDEVVTGIARTGIVAIIRGSHGDGATVGLRADMDALPIFEAPGKSYGSQHQGKMHACGHDGHMAMLLGAAKLLAQTRAFAGSVALIFQPAEEGGGGGKAMVEEGVLERFNIERVFGMHNMPGLTRGSFAIRRGPIMAGTSEFSIRVEGRGGHAAMPHHAIDPILIGSQIVSILHTVVSRNIDPIESAVLSVTRFHAGDAYNVIPEVAEIGGTVRALKRGVADNLRQRIHEICEGVARAHQVTAAIDYVDNYPVTVNHGAETELACEVASAVGDGILDRDTPPIMGSEDFSYMLNAKPGAFIFIGNGSSHALHHRCYDFNDEIIPFGIQYWSRLAERSLRPIAAAG